MRIVSRRLDELPGLPYQGQKFSIPKISDVFQSLAWLPLQRSRLLPSLGLQTLRCESPIPAQGKRQGCVARHDWMPLAAGSRKRTVSL